MSATSSFSDFTARLREFAPTDNLFESLALELFALQFQSNEPYRRFCQARHASPGSIEHWTEIPAVPASAF